MVRVLVVMVTVLVEMVRVTVVTVRVLVVIVEVLVVMVRVLVVTVEVLVVMVRVLLGSITLLFVDLPVRPLTVGVAVEGLLASFAAKQFLSHTSAVRTTPGRRRGSLLLSALS